MSESAPPWALEESDAAPAQLVAAPALELIQRAEIDTQIATAKKYPRADLTQIRNRMLSFATLDEETAESCFYTLRRKEAQSGREKLIQGPSVRLAEIAVACYGNLRAGARIIENDGRKVTSQGVCFDVENNVLISVEVDRRITGRDGRPYSEDMQITTANAAKSISFRNAVFKVVPMALIKPVFEEVKKVATGGAQTLAQKRDKIFKRLDQMGVPQARVLDVLERGALQDVDLDDLTKLIGLGTAIKEGEISVEDAFPGAPQEAPPAPQPKKKSFRDKILEEGPPASATRPEEVV